MGNCLFCDVTQGKVEHFVFWEDENFSAFLDQHPMRSGHVLVVPKKHIDYIFDMEDSLYEKLFLAAKKIAIPLKTVSNAKRIAIIVSGFQIPHVHISLVPLDADNEIGSGVTSTLTSEDGQRIVSALKELLTLYHCL